jgi:hypothetical protein
MLPSRGKKVIMDENTQKSCWGITARAMIGVAGILLVTWLIRGQEVAATIAVN